jgi:hypothetical protein
LERPIRVIAHPGKGADGVFAPDLSLLWAGAGRPEPPQFTGIA